MIAGGSSRIGGKGDIPEGLARRLSLRIGPVLSRLQKEGTAVWVVGGALRDLRLGRSLRDVDLAVRASREQVSALFPGGVWVGRGVPSFVLSSKGGKKGTKVQITVFTGSLEEELARRDFSINAMALRLSTEEGAAPLLIDPFGGMRDLSAGLLRRPCLVRDPFSEDPIRVLRLLRFAATLGFSVEPETLELAGRSCELLAKVAGERRHQELLALFGGDYLGKLPENFPCLFLGEVLAQAAGFAVALSEEACKRLPSLLYEAARHSRRDPLFRLWVFYREMGREGETVARHLPVSRSERRRLLRWDRLVGFLEKRKAGPWSAADRSLVMNDDQRDRIVRMVARTIEPKSRKDFRRWWGDLLATLCRPWEEVRESLSGSDEIRDSRRRRRRPCRAKWEGSSG